jgi:hypothetical protein
MVFTYLDRYYVRYHKLPTIREIGESSFKELVFSRTAAVTTAYLTSALITDITSDELGPARTIDDNLAKECALLCSTYGDGEFEKQLFERVKDHISSQADEQIVDLDIGSPKALILAEYSTTNRISSIVDKISSRTMTYLQHGEQRLSKIAEDTVMSAQQKIRSLLKPSVEAYRVQLYYDLSVLLESSNTSEATDNGNTRFQIIFDVVQFRDRNLEYIKEFFLSHALYIEALKHELHMALSRLKDAPKCLSKFCDVLLRNGGEKKLIQMLSSSAQASESLTLCYLEKSMELFRLLQDKDVFSEIFRNQLATRLLNARSESVDFERFVIGKMKHLCGPSFTNQTEGMLNDIALSRSYKEDFLAFQKDFVFEEESTKSFEFSVTVVTGSYWPNFHQINCKLPEPIDTCFQSFARFHKARHGGTRLQWINSLGNVEVHASYSTERSYTLHLVPIQAVVLMVFNVDSVVHSVTSLCNGLGIAEDIVKRVLHSFIKFDILKRIDGSSEVPGGDKIVLNDNFQYKLRKFSVPMSTLEAAYNPARISENRQNITEACIVRKMKVYLMVKL